MDGEFGGREAVEFDRADVEVVGSAGDGHVWFGAGHGPGASVGDGVENGDGVAVGDDFAFFFAPFAAGKVQGARTRVDDGSCERSRHGLSWGVVLLEVVHGRYYDEIL